MCAKGTITYPNGAPDRKAPCSTSAASSAKTSPWDLLDYQAEDNVFPDHSTFDQFLTDQKFEAYRRLGSCGAEAAMVLSAAPKPKKNGGVKVTQAQTYSATGKPQLELDQ